MINEIESLLINTILDDFDSILLFFNASATNPKPSAWYVIISIDCLLTMFSIPGIAFSTSKSAPPNNAEGIRLFLKNGTFLLKMLPANKPIAIMQNWSNHPQASGVANDVITSAFAALHNVIKIFIITRFSNDKNSNNFYWT